MKIGTVTGSVWATKKSPALRGHILLRVQTESGALIASDLVGAGVGDRVLLCTGGAARRAQPEAPIDAAIIGIVDEGGDALDH